jgi:hypothetical protein
LEQKQAAICVTDTRQQVSINLLVLGKFAAMYLFLRGRQPYGFLAQALLLFCASCLKVSL